jgi:arsenate reductase
MITVYGIPNCDTVKKARTWLAAHKVDHRFHDFRKDGIDAKTLRQWLKEVGADVLINRRGTTWRRLSDADKAEAEGASAAELLAREPSLIKRPVFDLGDVRVVGFSAAEQKILERALKR